MFGRNVLRALAGRGSRWLDGVRRSEHQLTLLLSLLIGTLVGLTIVAFILLTGHLSARMYPADAPAWRRLFVPVVGSLVSAFLLVRYFPLARGSGIPQTKFALFVGDGVIGLRTVVGKFVCCCTTLASGIALGREGPSVHIGAGLASLIGQRIGLSEARIKELIPLGGSAALAAAFNTPIAGVLFALEEIVGDLHAPILGGAVVSSATAWMILHAFLGDEPLFHVAGYQLVHPSELAIYAVLGVVGGVASAGFVKLLLWMRRGFLARPGRWAWLSPVAGGLMVGVLGFFVPEVLGVGYDYIERTLNGEVVLQVVVLLALLKSVATATCYASGNAGGIFGPSLFIGAMIGATVGAIAHALLPGSTALPGAYAVVGMGTAFAGIVRTPLTSVIMIFELTRDYTIIVPLMISNLLAYYVSHRLQRVPIYEALALQEGIHLPSGDHRGGARSGTVSQAIRPIPPAAGPNCTVADALAATQGSALEAWPVVAPDGFAGLLPAPALRDASDNGLGDAKVHALDRLDHATPAMTQMHLHPDHGLPLALERIHASGVRLLPVVSRANVRELLGLVSLADVVDALGVTARAEAAPRSLTFGELRLDAPSLATTVGIILAAVAALAAADTWLVRADRAQNRADARRNFEAGLKLEVGGDPKGAVHRFQGAVGLARGERTYRVALARAELSSDRVEEAQAALTDVLRQHHTDGEANLLMARASARRGAGEDAMAYYHRALYGHWPNDAAAHRAEVRFEVIDLLARRGPSRELLAELLLLEQSTEDPAIDRRIADLYLRAGAPDRSLDAWRRISRASPRDPAAYVGMGEAHLARHQYRAAAASFRTALRLDPRNERAQQHLALSDDVTALDPTGRGLSARTRYERSIALLALVRQELRECRPASADAARALPPVDEPADRDAAAERNLDEAERLWRTRQAGCPDSPASEKLALVLSAVSP
ncbi:MAG: chloride channel protein [Vicinamibacteraceae bacterium]